MLWVLVGSVILELMSFLGVPLNVLLQSVTSLFQGPYDYAQIILKF